MGHWFMIYAGVMGLMITALAMNVSYTRIKHKVANGDGGNREVKKAIRAHGNATEHSVVYGLMILALSFTAINATLLGALVTLFIISRLMHAASMLASLFNLRRAAILLTYLLELTAGVLCLGQVSLT